MPASEAQIRANQANARKSTGPRTEEGKAASRANSYKHGLTGAGLVIPEREAIEVRRRYTAFCAELNPSGEVGFVLAYRAATLSVRMERCVEHEAAALTDRVRRAEAEFVPPEGLDEDAAARLRAEAGKLALFDDSKPATLARRYEAAAERGFFRALKELRQLEKAAEAAEARFEAEMTSEESGSFSHLEREMAAFEARRPEPTPPAPRQPPSTAGLIDFPEFGPLVDVPITIGRRR